MRVVLDPVASWCRSLRDGNPGDVEPVVLVPLLSSGTFDTVYGKVKLVDNRFLDVFQTGQWQGGEYYGIGPARLAGARQPIAKPAWKQ